MDGGRYSVVPADFQLGGGFCVSLDRDFAGDTNMASMLYVRNKGRFVGSVDVGKQDPAGTAGDEEAGKKSIVLPSKVRPELARYKNQQARVEGSMPSGTYDDFL